MTIDPGTTNKPGITHFKQILKNKYNTEKLIAKKKQMSIKYS